MPKPVDPSSATNFTLEESTHSLVFTRRVAGSCERVFAAWTEPEQITAWWDPSGQPLARCEVDLRPGGSFTFVNAAHGAAPPFTGEYREIARPHRLVFEAMGALGTVLFEAEGAATRMTVRIQCRSPEHLQHFVQLGVAAGTSVTLDNLVAHCAWSRRAT